jgi:hypothetical protein
MAGIMAQIISVPRGDCGIPAVASASFGAAKAARRIISSATTQMMAAIQKMGSASE